MNAHVQVKQQQAPRADAPDALEVADAKVDLRIKIHDVAEDVERYCRMIRLNAEMADDECLGMTLTRFLERSIDIGEAHLMLKRLLKLETPA